MATVKITNDLRQTILDAATSIFTDRRRVAYKIESRWTAQSLIDFAFEPILDLLKQPDIQPFLSKTSSVRVQKLNGINPWEGFTAPTACLPIPNGRAYRRHVTNPDDTQGPIDAFKQYDCIALDFDNVHEVSDLHTAVVERDKRVAEVKAQQDEFTEVVKAVLDAHSTLAPALRAWPPLWELLDEKTKARHKEVVTRAKADKPTLDIDLGKATSIVVMKRMGL